MQKINNKVSDRKKYGYFVNMNIHGDKTKYKEKTRLEKRESS